MSFGLVFKWQFLMYHICNLVMSMSVNRVCESGARSCNVLNIFRFSATLKIFVTSYNGKTWNDRDKIMRGKNKGAVALVPEPVVLHFIIHQNSLCENIWICLKFSNQSDQLLISTGLNHRQFREVIEDMGKRWLSSRKSLQHFFELRAPIKFCFMKTKK